MQTHPHPTTTTKPKPPKKKCRELHIPPLEKENQLQSCVLTGYVSSQEGNATNSIQQPSPPPLSQSKPDVPAIFLGQAILGFSTRAFTGDKIYKWLTVIQRDCPTLLRYCIFATPGSAWKGWIYYVFLCWLFPHTMYTMYRNIIQSYTRTPSSKS